MCGRRTTLDTSRGQHLERVRGLASAAPQAVRT